MWVWEGRERECERRMTFALYGFESGVRSCVTASHQLTDHSLPVHCNQAGLAADEEKKQPEWTRIV